MTNQPRYVYLHGLPGSKLELSLFGSKLDEKLADVIVPSRNLPITYQNSAYYFDALAEQVDRSCGSAPIHLIGFSLGAAAAIQLAARLSERVMQIDLISAAAPLQSGAFTKAMAGGALFETAMQNPGQFAVMVRLQAFVARAAPSILFKILFAQAKAGDKVLSENPEFRSQMLANLTQSLGRDFKSYQREILYYVEDWSNLLLSVKQPVALWQGLDDDWTPPTMAEAIVAALPNGATLDLLEGRSHFSTLQHYLEQLPIQR